MFEHAPGVVCGRDCGPHEAAGSEALMQGIELPADGVPSTVLLDGAPITVSVRVLPTSLNYGEHTPNDLRQAGWSVACHNDYRQNGEPFTFWLFTKSGFALKGEGRTDAEALDAVRHQAEHHVSTLPVLPKRVLDERVHPKRNRES